MNFPKAAVEDQFILSLEYNLNGMMSKYIFLQSNKKKGSANEV